MSKSSSREWLNAHKLEYVPLNSELAVLRVLAGLTRGTPLPASPVLVAGAPHTIVRAPVLGSVTHRPSRRMRTADHLLWRATFALPIELLECPQTLFALVAGDRMPMRLPAPELSSIEALCRHWELGAHRASLLSQLTLRRVAALGTTFAVAGSSVFPPTLALADGHGHGVSKVHHHAAVVSVDRASEPASSSQQSTVVAAEAATAHPRHHRHHRHHHAHHHHRKAQPQPTNDSSGTSPAKSTNSTSTSNSPAPPQGSGGVSGPGLPTPAAAPQNSQTRHHHHTGGRPVNLAAGGGLSTISPVPPAGLIGNGESSAGETDHRSSHRGSGAAVGGFRHLHGHHAGGHGRRPASSGGASLPSHQRPASTPSSKPEPVATPTPSTLPASSSNYLTTGMGMSKGEVALLSHLSGLYVKGLQPPSFLVPIYKKAGKRFHIPWQVLAAINSIETDYGRNLNISSAGAVGWMQFMPSTWREYGMSVHGNGPPNPYDPTDAIFSAANYLAANGGAHHLRKAIFAYNHAVWYVDSVLWRAGIITDHAQGIHHLGGYALPLDGRFMRTFGRTDDGLDIEDAPDGAAVYSMTPGVVTAVASDPSGFGPNYPVIRVTKGPLTGQYIYYGHVAISLVKVGQHVIAGQPIAIMGHTGDAVDLGHGHIEIGFSDSSGDPLNHHGPEAWTPSGAAMRRVLVALAAGFHIKVR
jgi:murein DD-endopeptidase MepM/ murein hydrolase activator NlpD